MKINSLICDNKYIEERNKVRIQIIHSLYDMYKESKEKKIKVSHEYLYDLLFDSFSKISPNGDTEKFYVLFEMDDETYDKLKFVLSIDGFCNFEYHNLYLTQKLLDIMRENNIILNLDNIYQKNLENLDIYSMTIDGSFDSVRMGATKFINNRDKNGALIKINPQTLYNKCMYYCEIENVIFTGSFDGCDIEGARLRDNEGMIISPQELKNKSLSHTHINGALFTSSLNDCQMNLILLVNVLDAYVDIGAINLDDKINFNSIKIYAPDTESIKILKRRFDHNLYDGSVIVCSPSAMESLKWVVPSMRSGNVKFLTEEYTDNLSMLPDNKKQKIKI